MLREELVLQLIDHMERLERKLEFLNVRVGKLDEVQAMRQEAAQLKRSASELQKRHETYLQRRATQIKEAENVEEKSRRAK